MKGILLLLLLLPCLALAQSAKTATVSGQSFVFKTVETAGESGSLVQVEVWRGAKKLLTHTLSLEEGDCNSQSVALGTYETGSSALTFYSYWARAGDAPVSPYGVRKQVYRVDKAGNLYLQKGELYIETSRPGWWENRGIKYLFEAPQNDSERTALAQYISEAEKNYGGRFVLGKAKDRLFTEVRSKLKGPIQRATGTWKKYYADKLGGYKI